MPTPEPSPEEIAELRAGLSKPLPEIPCKYFYDDRGSDLFTQITELPEYYPTRTEEAILEVEADRTTAIARAIEQAQDGDVVLIAGKGAEQGQEYADRTIPFDDREAARDVLNAR